jgi:hypothetical protein
MLPDVEQLLVGSTSTMKNETRIAENVYWVAEKSLTHAERWPIVLKNRGLLCFGSCGLIQLVFVETCRGLLKKKHAAPLCEVWKCRN